MSEEENEIFRNSEQEFYNLLLLKMEILNQ